MSIYRMERHDPDDSFGPGTYLFEPTEGLPPIRFRLREEASGEEIAERVKAIDAGSRGSWLGPVHDLDAERDGHR